MAYKPQHTLNVTIQKIKAIAPATSANLAVGFDSLGMALAQPYDEVILTPRDDNQLVITSITPDRNLPMTSQNNTVTLAIQALLDDCGIDAGFNVSLHKGIPIASGMGGSAASAVAGLVAINGYLKAPLTLTELLPYALAAESAVSGGIHPDNVAPALWGGLTLSVDNNTVQPLPCPTATAILLHPNHPIKTRDARHLLPQQISLADHIRQTRCFAAFIASLYEKNWALMCQQMQDYLIEPARSPLWPYYEAVKAAGYEAGAAVIFISGSGPSVAAFCHTDQHAETIAKAMQQACKVAGYTSRYWMGSIPAQGAQIIEVIQ